MAANLLAAIDLDDFHRTAGLGFRIESSRFFEAFQLRKARQRPVGKPSSEYTGTAGKSPLRRTMQAIAMTKL